MKKIFEILFLIAICLVKKGESQNLVPNASFENFVECQDTSSLQFHALLDSFWYQFGSADYFNACATSGTKDIPQNIVGYQFAFDGNAYIGLYGYHSLVFTREYIEIQLTNPLIPGQIYYVSFYVSLADTMQYAIENIGVLFTDTLFDPFPAPSYNWVTAIPQIENAPGNMLNNKINWVVVSDSFVANGGEKFMTIGNFKDEAQTVKQYFGGTDPSTLGAYYFIDQVYVGLSPSVNIENHKKETTDVKLYPNPPNGNLTLEYNLQENESGELIIYSLAGIAVKSAYLNSGLKALNIDAYDLQSGMYLYELKINGKAGRKNKLMIIK